MADVDKKQVVQQIVALQKEYGELTTHLEFHLGPAKRAADASASPWKLVEALKDRQDLIDKRLRYLEKFVLS